MARLRITEIFLSLQGEARSVGLPTVFVRLTGCPLRCRYCDTAYAFSGGEHRTLDEVLEQVGEFGTSRVCVTGGEPLAQTACGELLTRLCDAGYQVSLETSGALDVSCVDSRVERVIDLKTPASGEVEKNHWDNLEALRSGDQIKFVIADRKDYEWSREVLATHALAQQCQVLFSPVHGDLEPARLAEWILEDRLEVRFQMQLHKWLWGEQPGR
ncbi:MAG: 7-carboxy-7-deazaguanine synthase QueE [Candidatus Thiodiazotropha sp.]